MPRHCVLITLFVVALAFGARAADDILIADFESDTYGDWEVEGTAFGSRPARKRAMSSFTLRF